MKLSRGWWLIRTDAPHDILAGPFVPPKDDDRSFQNTIAEGFHLAEGYAKANYKPHIVSFLYVPIDNFAWGE